MQALMTYRTHELIEKRHGRHYQDKAKNPNPQGSGSNMNGRARGPPNKSPLYFTMNSYLKYQGQKFVKRFDANCYVAITYKLDTHDVSWHAPSQDPEPSDVSESSDTRSDAQHQDESERLIYEALQQIEQPALVLGVQSDALFAFREQEKIARGIPDSRLENIESIEGHDAFLLQFKQVNDYLLGFWHERLSDLMERKPRDGWESELDGVQEPETKKQSTVGEAEPEDITAW